MADPGGAKQGGDDKAYLWRLHRIFALYVVGVVAFLALMAWAEQRGLSRHWIGPIFLFLTVMVYAGIGVYGRTTDPEEYYVAGRRIPPIYNGMAAAADWMSAASFISLSGALYLQGFSGTPGQAGGLAYLLGWTGGFCLVALLIAPHLRAMGLYTVPDFFHVRFGGRWPRIIAALAAVLCSFTYVVAQIYGVGLIASRLTGVQFEIGIMLGLGGVLLCSFLGGMRAITWTQVAQYVVVLLAFLIPVSWLAYKQLGNPMAPLVYGAQLGKIADMEERLLDSPAEHQVVVAYLRRAQDFEARLQDVEGALERERQKARERVRALRDQNADVGLIVSASRELVSLPRDAASARERWTREMRENYERARPLGGLPLHSQAFAGDPNGSPHERKEYELARRNFLALMFCLMVGTAGLPHLLTRYYTAPSVAAARTSVAWSLFFIALLYLSAPALAVLVKFEVMQNLVGSSFETLPNWLAQWARVDASLLSVEDVNGDGLVQFGEIRLGADLIMLATPELGGAAVCRVGPGGCGRAGGGIVHGRRVAADHQQRAGARPLLPRGSPRGIARTARHPDQVHLAVGGAGGGVCGSAQAGRNSAARVCVVFSGCVGLCAGDGAGYLLARNHAPGGGGRHARRAGHCRVLHAFACARLAHLGGLVAGGWPVVWHPAHFCGGVWRARRADRGGGG